MDEKTRCVAGAWAGQSYPTIALWRPAPLLDVLAGYPLEARGPRLRDIQAKLEATQLDYAGFERSDPFAGVNTLADLLALSRRLIAIG